MAFDQSIDKSWMNKGNTKHEHCQSEFQKGLNQFLDFASRHSSELQCPCLKCENKCFYDRETIRWHVIKNGFLRYYTTWVYHGECLLTNNTKNWRVDRSANDLHGLFYDTQHQDEYIENSYGLFDVEYNNNHDAEFEKLMNDACTPLYPGCRYTKREIVIETFKAKCENKWSNKSISVILEIHSKTLPDGNCLSKSWHECQKLMSSLGLDYIKIHACLNNCVLFRKEYAKLDKCPKCHASRYTYLG